MRVLKTIVEFKEEKAVRYLDYNGHMVNIPTKLQDKCINVIRAFILMETIEIDDRIEGINVVKMKEKVGVKS